jgi:hypothetical protein
MKTMTCIWGIDDAYPESLIGRYDRVSNPDRFLLGKGIRLDSESGSWRFFFPGQTKSLRKFDDLANNALVPLVSARLASLLIELAPDDVQLLPAEIEAQDGRIDDFHLLNVISMVPAVDRALSIFSLVRGTQAIMSFKKLMLILDCLGSHVLARSAEYRSHVLVSHSLVEAIQRAGMLGMQFTLPEDI